MLQKSKMYQGDGVRNCEIALDTLFSHFVLPYKCSALTVVAILGV